MDIRSMLPLLLKGKMGEREQALLRLTQNPDPDAISRMLAEMYTEKRAAPSVDTYALLKKIIPAQTLGQIIKYFNSRSRK